MSNRRANLWQTSRALPSTGLILAALVPALAACSDLGDEKGPRQADSGSIWGQPDATTTEPDAGVAPDAGSTGGDAGPNLPPNGFLVHYHRPLADYAGWTATLSGDVVEATASADDTYADGFGAAYLVTLKAGATSFVVTLNDGTDVDPAGAVTIDVSGGQREAWIFSGYATGLTHVPGAIPGPDQAVVFYGRPDNQYSGWGLHTWGDVLRETAWGTPLRYSGVDPEFGAYYVIDTKPGAETINIIVHMGDVKDPGPDMGWKISELGRIVFVVSGSSQVLAVPQKAGVLAIGGAKAHLIAPNVIAWKIPDTDVTQFELRTSQTADIVAGETDVTGGTVLTLTERAGGLTTAERTSYKYLANGFRAFELSANDAANIEDALKGQLVAVARKADGTVKSATQVQIAALLDQLYAYQGPLGVTFQGQVPTFDLWAPTAQAVKLHVYDAAKAELAVVDMTRGASGTWTHTGEAAWYGNHYRYEVTVYHPNTLRIEDTFVTDPYAVNLSTNGVFAQIIDLQDPALKPWGWDTMVKPALDAPEDMVIYESHVRDFSVTDETVPAAWRGKYLAFTATVAGERSNGMQHLADLASAGLTHVHLLPVFDIATIDEDPDTRVNLDDPFQRLCEKNPAVPMATCTQYAGQTIHAVMASLEGDSQTQQEIATYMAGLDSFNWGYDPFHYGAPEGSYATTAEGSAKVVEFRRMVKGLNDVGLRVVMDVVYNHTNAAGLGEKSVLDKVVPGYYHRRDPETGYIYTTTCCQNTATEHVMMERLMTDTLVTWAKEYKVDGFRFDIMGHHSKANILHVRDTLQALTVANDGVDGSKIYLYGEGWNFGETANSALFVNANQENMAGTGVGTFNDRIRDAVRGGGAFDAANDLRKNQGFANGLWYDPNELATATDADKTKLNEATDRIKVSMAGNLRDIRLVKSSGEVTNGGGVGYNGARTGYTQDPQETINYVSAHDNQTIFDMDQYKTPTGTSMADRVRIHGVALDTVALGQGIPFFHMGDDLLRSKSMERDSYNSGDWFNRVDWSGATNGWKSGLPNMDKDSGNWAVIRAIFADTSIAPTAAHITAATTHFQEMLRVRKSSPLFRLRTKAEIMARVDYPNFGPSQVPALLVQTITDGTCAGADLDPDRDALVVIINADKVEHSYPLAGATGFTLHSILAGSADTTVRTASFANGTFTVPARTTAVFEQRQSGAQGAGLPCNTR